MSNKLSMCAILESHVNVSKLTGVCSYVFPNWQWTSNNNVCQKGTRIILGWDPGIVNVMVLSSSEQVMHCQVIFVHDNSHIFISYIYAANYYSDRRKLWNELTLHHRYVRDFPWVLMGDFNSSLHLDDSTSGSSKITISMRKFRECIDSIQVTDLNHMGLHFTWNQKPKASSGILKKIDRVMVNDAFLTSHVNAYALFQPYRISDHSPAILKIPAGNMVRRKHFRFSNYIVYKDQFQSCVKEGWDMHVEGHSMFQLVKKL
ncbi:uncharacterized protein [Rutidosis leptorrhynchoides]|uniref:uncharacterized protein n=1 Tax=Rutidosis leptorrhynchoides TaxID=125765 RepID=UPI003A98DC8B